MEEAEVLVSQEISSDATCLRLGIWLGSRFRGGWVISQVSV